MQTFRIRSASATRLICALSALAVVASAGNALANPKIVVDARTGKVIAHEDAFLKWYPASLTKLMTAYVTFKALKTGRLSLDTPVVMSKSAADQPASKMYFTPGTTMTMDNALKMMLVKSANDMAVAVAEAVGGTQEQFVAMMNAQAKALGMNSTQYINPHGLPGKGQFSTARDLALLTLRLKQDFPEYQSYFSLEGIDTGSKQYPNFNTLIGRFDGADGMKTGFICASGFNQIGSATRDGRTVISVVLGSDSLAGRADDTANLLQQGLSSTVSQGRRSRRSHPMAIRRRSTTSALKSAIRRLPRCAAKRVTMRAAPSSIRPISMKWPSRRSIRRSPCFPVARLRRHRPRRPRRQRLPPTCRSRSRARHSERE